MLSFLIWVKKNEKTLSVAFVLHFKCEFVSILWKIVYHVWCCRTLSLRLIKNSFNLYIQKTDQMLYVRKLSMVVTIFAQVRYCSQKNRFFNLYQIQIKYVSQEKVVELRNFSVHKKCWPYILSCPFWGYFFIVTLDT